MTMTRRAPRPASIVAITSINGLARLRAKRAQRGAVDHAQHRIARSTSALASCLI